MQTLNIYTNQETQFLIKSLELLNIDYELKREVRNDFELVHDEFNFKTDKEQNNILALLLNYNYERNLSRWKKELIYKQ